MSLRIATLLFALSFAVQLNAETARESVALMSAPSARSEPLVTIPAGAEISLQSRKGLWSEACFGDVCGWLRITSISRAAGSERRQSTSLAALKSGREGAGNAVSSTGVRGLDADSIKVDKPDYDALARLKERRVTTSDYVAFTSEVALETRALALLEAPLDQEVERGAIEPEGAVPADRRMSAPGQKKKPKPKPKESDDDW